MQRKSLKNPRRYKLLETVFYKKPGDRIPTKTFIVSTRQDDEVESYHLSGIGPKVLLADLIPASEIKGSYHE